MERIVQATASRCCYLLRHASPARASYSSHVRLPKAPVSKHQPIALHRTRDHARSALAAGSDATLAACVKVFFDNLLHNGQVPGRVYMSGTDSNDFYHADWGGGFEALDAMHNDKATKKAVLMAMQRYVKWVGNNRDPEGSGLTDIVNHFENGQECLAPLHGDRRQGRPRRGVQRAVPPQGHRRVGVPLSPGPSGCYAVAEEIQEKAMANRFHRRDGGHPRDGPQEDVGRQVRHVHGPGPTRAGARPTSRRLSASTRWRPTSRTRSRSTRCSSCCRDRDEFWAKYPVPSIAMSDSTFDRRGPLEGHAQVAAPWNGRTWPIVNSHILGGVSPTGPSAATRRRSKSRRRADQAHVAMMSGELDGTEQANCLRALQPRERHRLALPRHGRRQPQRVHARQHLPRSACGIRGPLRRDSGRSDR